MINKNDIPVNIRTRLLELRTLMLQGYTDKTEVYWKEAFELYNMNLAESKQTITCPGCRRKVLRDLEELL